MILSGNRKRKGTKPTNRYLKAQNIFLLDNLPFAYLSIYVSIDTAVYGLYFRLCHPYLILYIYLSVNQALDLPTYLTIHVAIYRSISRSVLSANFPFLPFPSFLPFYPYTYLTPYLISISLSLSLSAYPIVHLKYDR